MPTCCALVLNYNGLEHLKECIPSLLKAAEKVPGGCPVMVVDNRSKDESLNWLRENHPSVGVRISEKNDYLFSYNPVIEERDEEIVIILNNDMRFDENFILAMLPRFKDPLLFAVSPREMDWEGKKNITGQSFGKIRNSWFYRERDLEITQPCLSLEAGGGCAIYRRSMFLELGGYDRLFYPGYWEDADLSFRAWQRGWKILFEPSSITYHRGSASWDKSKGGPPSVTRLIRRNEVLFALRNVGGWGFVLGFLLFLPIRMLRNALMGNHSMWQGAFLAIPKIPLALWRRYQGPKNDSRDFSKILEAIRNSPFLNNPN